jgi:hypothetical protein
MSSPTAASPLPARRAAGLLSHLLLALLLCLCAGLALEAGAQRVEGAAGDKDAPQPATLRLLNRDIVTLRAVIAGATPQRRVDIALERIKALP